LDHLPHFKKRKNGVYEKLYCVGPSMAPPKHPTNQRTTGEYKSDRIPH